MACGKTLKAKTFKPKTLNNKGQMAVEMTLLTLVGVGMIFMAIQVIKRDESVAAQFILGPWKKISGMMESGVWEEAEPARQLHPGHFKRMYGVEGAG